MSVQPISLHAAGPEDFTETLRAWRLTLHGAGNPERVTWRMGLFNAWAERVFLPVIAPHLLAVRAEAEAGNARAVVELDRALDAPESSSLAGRAWLENREGVRGHAVFRRLRRLAAAGETPAHFHTVLAVQAEEFHVAWLPMLQAALFAEWRAARPFGPSRGEVSPEEFYVHTRSVMSRFPSLITPYVPAQPLAAVR